VSGEPEPAAARIEANGRLRGAVDGCSPVISVRLDQRASDTVLATLLKMTNDHHRDGEQPAHRRRRRTAALPRSTAIHPPLGQLVRTLPGQQATGILTVPLVPGAAIDHLVMQQSDRPRFATVRRSRSASMAGRQSGQRSAADDNGN